MSVFRAAGAKNYRIQFQIAGKTYVKSSRTSDKRIAERMEAEWRTQIHARQYLKERESITLNEMFDAYLLQPLSETTKRNARCFFRLFRRHTSCDVYAHEFNQAELEKYVFARRKSGKRESGIRTHVLVFKGAWNRTNKKIYNVPELQAPNSTVLKNMALSAHLHPLQEARHERGN